MVDTTLSVTIKLFLPHGDPKRLRTAEISNWSGKAIAAPRTDFEEFLKRDEMSQSGVYILTGTDLKTGDPIAYIGEAEVLRDRLPAHRSKEYWVQSIAFVSKDENLTKSHIRYLEGRLLEEAGSVGSFKLENAQSSGSRLPESDRADMEVFLGKVRQLLPVLGSEIVSRLGVDQSSLNSDRVLTCEIKGAVAQGERTSSGFVIFKNSKAVLEDRPSAATRHPYVLTLRQKLIAEGSLTEKGDFLIFVRDVEFTSPSAAASVVHGGGANGLTSWKNSEGQTLKEVEGDET